MIYRKWSLLTGPMTILGGIVGATIATNYLFFENEWLLRRFPKKEDASTPSK